MDQKTARARKPFQYKADEDSDDSMPEALDEQEQESLIQTLQTRNETRNTQYKTAFTALILLSTLPYLASFYFLHTGPQTSILSILAITSLVASAYILYCLPAASTGFPRLDAWLLGARRKPGGESSGSTARLPQLGDRVDKSPLELYLPSLNLVLVVLVAVIDVLGAGGGQALGIAYALLPAGVLGLVVVVKMEMGSVDLSELEGLRYGYKGA